MTGTYTVTHTMTDDCGNGDVFIEVKDLTIQSEPDASFTFTNIPCSSTVLFNSLEEGIHEWTFGGAGPNSSLQNPLLTFENDGIYTVTHTVTNACGTDTYVMDVILVSEDCYDCECPSNSGQTIYEIGSDISSVTYLSMIPHPTIINDACFQVQGKFIIDENIENFSNSTFIMNPGSEIEVHSDINFSVSSSLFRGCTNMWKGITFLNNASFDLKESTIMDAKHALRAEGDVNFTLLDNFFNMNEVGIYTFGWQSKLINTPIPMRNNYFMVTGGLLPGYPGQTPISDASTPCGILLSNTAMVIGSQYDNNAINYFNNLTTGIHAGNGLLGVFYTQMTDPVLNPNGWSWAIQSFDNFAIVENNTIEDYRMGIDGIWGIFVC